MREDGAYLAVWQIKGRATIPKLQMTKAGRSNCRLCPTMDDLGRHIQPIARTATHDTGRYMPDL